MRERQATVILALVVMVASVGIWSVYANEGADDIRHLITSERAADRRQAEQSILDTRQREIEALRRVITSPIEKGEQFYGDTPRNTAIRLLGSLRAKEAVPDLIPLLAPQKGQGKAMFSLMLLPHAGEALVEIGLPAVRPLIDTAKQEGVEAKGPFDRGQQCLRTLVAILGPEGTEHFLKRSVEAETDPAKHKNLQDALVLLGKPRFVVKGLVDLHNSKYNLP